MVNLFVVFGHSSQEKMMGFAKRLGLIQKIEELRQSKVICYLTSLRPNLPAQIADDAVRVFFDHLLKIKKKPIPKLDIFICSNGGSGTVPWRLVSLFREFANNFNVLVPYRAYSAASLLALGADEIVMHPFGELGPIDPKVTNEFNPLDNAQNSIGINVEDVRAYVNFIKTTVGITHEDELIKAIEILVQKVHPLALGNVERFVMQSRMIAGKILKTHMTKADDHIVNEIVENMAAKLYFHGHPINRKEAKEDLNLKIANCVNAQLEKVMWELYLDFEEEFENRNIFNPASDLSTIPFPQISPPPTGIEELQVVGTIGPKIIDYPTLLHAIVESSRLSSRYITHRRFEEYPSPPPQRLIREELLSQRWIESVPPRVKRPIQPSKKVAEAARTSNSSPTNGEVRRNRSPRR